MRLKTPRLPIDATVTRVNLAAITGTLAMVSVPIAPSTNNLFATVGRKRIPTREYKAWQEVAYPILETLVRPVVFPCEVCLTLRGKVRANSDIDNRIKAILDALVTVGVLPGDSLAFVRRLTMEYVRDDGEPRVDVRADGGGA